MMEDDMVGGGILNLNDLSPNGQYKGMIGLKYKGKHAGDLYLEVEFYSHSI